MLSPTHNVDAAVGAIQRLAPDFVPYGTFELGSLVDVCGKAQAALSGAAQQPGQGGDGGAAAAAAQDLGQQPIQVTLCGRRLAGW